MIPSYWGWINVRNLPLDLQTEDHLRVIGNKGGGFIQCVAKAKTTYLSDCLEASINLSESHFVGTLVEIHGGFSPQGGEPKSVPDAFVSITNGILKSGSAKMECHHSMLKLLKCCGCLFSPFPRITFQ